MEKCLCVDLTGNKLCATKTSIGVLYSANGFVHLSTN